MTFPLIVIPFPLFPYHSLSPSLSFLLSLNLSLSLFSLSLSLSLSLSRRSLTRRTFGQTDGRSSWTNVGPSLRTLGRSVDDR